MKKIILILLMVLGILQAQVSLSDINKIGNERLDELREELKSQETPQASFEDNFEDVKSIPVKILNEEENTIDEQYFGYNYLQNEINFFDNIPTPPDFKLGVGDEIILSLWGEINLREKFIINKEGLIYYKNVGFINLSNKTIKEAEATLLSELSTIYSTLKDSEKSTDLMLELGKLKSLNIYFSGEVFKPGIQLVHPFSDIFAALVQAGGINKNGSLRNIQLIRNNKIISSIDFYEFFISGSNVFSNIKLIDGDIIHVPVIKNRIEIQGSVLRPGYYEILPKDRLNDAISYAAGLEAKASSFVTLDTVKPINERTSQDNILSSINIDLKNSDSLLLNNGDVIKVRSVGDSSSKLEIFGRVKAPGVYSAVGMSLKDILDIAGGFDDPIYRQSIIDDKITILRKDKNNFYSKELIVAYKDAESTLMSADDKIFVYEDINYKTSLTYRIEGEVYKPGTYQLKKGTTLEDTLKEAGGLTELSSISNVIVSQEFTDIDENGIETTVVENIANVSSDFKIDRNAVIKALPFENLVRVQGNVYSPGLVAFSKRMTMYDAIIQAGGYKPYTIKKNVYVVSSNGEVDKANFFRLRFKPLNPGDTVIVPKNPNPSDDFDVTTFVANMASTLANIAAILLIIDNQNN